ncbi:MAG: TIGR04086 family membrane protein [Rubrobacteraceae bacterium]
MTDKPEDHPEERRRTGPLGDDAESGTTRREPPGDEEPTRQVPADEPARDEPARETQPMAERPAGEPAGDTEDKETRVIRTPPAYGTQADASPYPRGYFEAAEEREDRLRDMYGGVDWLASFLGFIFALVAGCFFTLVAGLVVAPLGVSMDLAGSEIGPAAITGLVLVAILVFLTYFFGGYVAGRLARFDGGRNGAMLLLWTGVTVLVLALINAVLSGFLPEGISEEIDNLIQNLLFSTIGGLSGLGIVGVLIFVGALLVALVGGFLGGRLGSRYHAEIDRTT